MTGATPEQIEAATGRYYDSITPESFGEDGEPKHAWDRLDDANRRAWIQEWDASAEYLVTPTQRIVEVADLAALLALIEWLVGLGTVNVGDDILLLDRISALIGGDE